MESIAPQSEQQAMNRRALVRRHSTGPGGRRGQRRAQWVWHHQRQFATLYYNPGHDGHRAWGNDDLLSRPAERTHHPERSVAGAAQSHPGRKEVTPDLGLR